MHLTPKDEDRLLLFLAAELARKRRAAGLKLTYAEARALIAQADADSMTTREVNVESVMALSWRLLDFISLLLPNRALLVLSIRRGSKLATAMEARGFGAPVRRTWARTSTFGAREWLLVSAGAAISAISVAAAVWAGTWNFILGPR